METRHTAKTGIIVRHYPGIGWAHFDTNDNRAAKVGPWYATKAELLADHESYLHRAGWIRGE